jgi:hypothetical protein
MAGRAGGLAKVPARHDVLQALKREMARYVYPSKIDPDVRANRRKEVIPLSDGQKESIGKLDRHFASARLARMQGKVDVPAARAISPASFDGAEPGRHEEIAGDVQKNLGILKSSAIRRVIDTHADNPTVDHIAKTAKERKGKPGVVFAHSLESVRQISARLEKEGHRVVTITGADSAQEKDRKRQLFNPERGEAKADILVASDAGSTGMNIQRGQWLYQADTPQTAMAQPLDAKVLTPQGWKRMGDMRVGDEVVTPCGAAAPVLGVYPQGRKQIFRVTFSDGASTRSCLDHLWLTKSRDDVKNGRAWRVRTLTHLKRTLGHMECGQMRPNYQIPLIVKIDSPSPKLPIPAYLMGALLGDGSFGDRHVTMTMVDQDVISRVAECVGSLDAQLSRITGIDYRLVGNGSMTGFPALRPSPVLWAVRSLGIEGGIGAAKYIPAPYLCASHADRLALLQGLMDTDGTIDKRNGHSSFCNTSRHLIDGIVDLVRSLGGIATVGSERQSSYAGKAGKPHWKVSVSLPEGIAPFHCRQKAMFLSMRGGRPLVRTITSVVACEVAEAQCILVGHPDHLYVTDDYIVTHNTHAQRQGRIFRTGQKNDVELIDAVQDHPEIHRARDRLTKKYGLRDLMSSPMEGLDDTGVGYYIKQRQVEQQQGGLF